MRNFRFFTINVLPIIVIMAIIFIASSQTSDQQDISPVLDRATDAGWLRETFASMKGFIDELASRGINVLLNNPLLAFLFAAGICLFTAAVFFRLFKSSEPFSKKLVKSIIYTGIIFMFAAVVAVAVQSDAAVGVLRGFLSIDLIRSILQSIDFTYAGTRVSLETFSLENMLQFILRKAAHFILFGLLGFFLFLALHKLNGKSLRSFIITMIVVIAYAALDEYRQSLTPTRAGLVEDVILDTAGGLFGATMGWLKRVISKWWG